MSDQRVSTLGPAREVASHEVFVSYSSSDAQTAQRLVAYLEDRGIRCWVAPRDVPPGADFAEQVVRAIDRSRALVVLVSDAANSSPHVRRELERAVGQGCRIVPLQIGTTVSSDKLSYFFSGVQWLHVGPDPTRESLDEVVEAIRHGSPGLEGRPPVPFHKVLSAGVGTVRPVTKHRLATFSLVCAATLVLAPLGLILGLCYLASPRRTEEGRIAAWTAVVVSMSVLIVAGGALAVWLSTSSG